MSRIRAILLVCAVFGTTPAFGASPDPKDLAVSPTELSKARELVRKLGSELYREREEAQAELSKMGRLARLAITEGVASNDDPEIRLRCTRLLPKASADDLKARIDTFLADNEGKFEHDLPGLKTFRKHVGATVKVRELYVEILKSPYNMDMFSAMDKSETEGGRAVADRRNAMWNDMQHRPFPPNGKPVMPRQPTLSDIAALLFAETVINSDNIPKSNNNWINGTQFIQQQASMNALSNAGAAHADAYKEIVRKWLATRTDPNELTNLSYQLGNTTLKQFKESMPLLRKIIMAEGVQGYAKGQALNAIMQQKGKEETAFLKTLMNNDTMIQQVWFGKPNGQAEMHSCLMKDVALAYLISQSGGNIKDYHFETPQGVIVNPNQLGFGQYAFTSDDKRGAGFMKYGWKQLKESMDPPAKDAPKQPAPKETPKDAPKDGTAPTPIVKPIVRPLPPPHRHRPAARSDRRSKDRPALINEMRAAGFISAAVRYSTHRRGNPPPPAARTVQRTPPATRSDPMSETRRSCRAARRPRAGTGARAVSAAPRCGPRRHRNTSGRSRERPCPTPARTPLRGTGPPSAGRSRRA